MNPQTNPGLTFMAALAAFALSTGKRRSGKITGSLKHKGNGAFGKPKHKRK